MRIYTKVVLQFDADGNLHIVRSECESYDHDGDVSLCKGGDAPKVKESENEKALAKIAAEKWDNFRKNYVPLENDFIETTKAMGSEGERANIVGKGVASVQQAVDAQTPQVPSVTGQVNRGLGLGAGRSTAAVVGAGSAETRAQQGKLALIKLGRGMDATGTAGMTREAANANAAGIARATADQAESAAGANTLGNVVGLGLTAMSKPKSTTPAPVVTTKP
jgi:hypothetical protein